MQGYNLIVVLNENLNQVLMCERKKPPYLGLWNMVGGKIEQAENHEAAAYRELEEETGITKEDIHLTHLMDFTYQLDNIFVEVYVGQLLGAVTLQEEVNKLFWTHVNHDFFSMEQFAGEGNIGHIMEHIKLAKDRLFHK